MFKRTNLYILSFVSVLLFNTTALLADTSPGDIIANGLVTICQTNVNNNPASELSNTCINELGLAIPNNPNIPNSPGGSLSGNGGNGGSSGNLISTAHFDRIQKKIKKRNEDLQKKAASGDILSSEKLGFFSAGSMTETERDSTILENGYESDSHGFTAGADYFFTNQFVAGIAVNYTNTDLDYNNNGGYSDYESVSVLTYANFNVNDHLSIDGYVGWTGVYYDLQRNIRMARPSAIGGGILSATAKADTEANKVFSGISLAYNMNFNAIDFTPSLKLDYSGTFLDAYTESAGSGLALKYDNQDIQSFKSNLGFNSSYAISMPWGVLIPQIHAAYIHEFLDHRRTIHASFVQDVTNFDLQFKTDKPDRDYFVFGGGISAILAHSVQLFVDYERTEGNRYLNSFIVSGGVRIGF